MTQTTGAVICFDLRNEFARLLDGMPHAAVVLYLWLRSRMTWETRMVGADPKARINWQAATEALAIEWRPGLITPCSYDQARRAGRQLVRRGLVRMWSDSTERVLIFECIRAPQNSSVQKQAARSKRAMPPDPTPRETPLSRQIKNEHAARHLDFVVPEVHPNARASNSPVDNHGGTDLIFPPRLTPQVNRALGALLRKSNANGSAQLVLDELQALYDRNGVCRNPVSYVKSLVEADQRGEFWPSNAAMKVARARREAQTQCNNAAAHNPERRATRQTITDALAKLKKLTVH